LLDSVFPDDAPHTSVDGTWIMVEDTSLEFDNLNGLPGAYIKDFFGTLGLQKLSALARAPLDVTDASGPAGAHARTLLALVPLLPPGDGSASPDPVVIEGVTDGHIVPLPADFTGPSFGFDPIFYVPSVGATYHDMGMETKNGVSHRGKAVTALAAFLTEKATE
jgi:inosine triphosphate pyrophosphatase